MLERTAFEKLANHLLYIRNATPNNLHPFLLVPLGSLSNGKTAHHALSHTQTNLQLIPFRFLARQKLR
jgi:hypothetical protein